MGKQAKNKPVKNLNLLVKDEFRINRSFQICFVWSFCLTLLPEVILRV